MQLRFDSNAELVLLEQGIQIADCLRVFEHVPLGYQFTRVTQSIAQQLRLLVLRYWPVLGKADDVVGWLGGVFPGKREGLLILLH